jgi:hypothetical protein
MYITVKICFIGQQEERLSFKKYRKKPTLVASFVGIGLGHPSSTPTCYIATFFTSLLLFLLSVWQEEDCFC